MMNANQEDPRAVLIRGRAADWQRRSDKWHGVLDTERRWDWSGAAVPPAIYALGVLVIALGVGAPALVSAIAGLAASLFGVRAYLARQAINAGGAERAWVTADRMAEQYKSVVARLAVGEDIALLMLVSDKLEATGRFGLPSEVGAGLQDAIGIFPNQGGAQ